MMPRLGSLARFTHPVSLVLTGVVSSLLLMEAMPAPKAALMQMQPAGEVREADGEVNGAAVLAIAALGSAGIGVALTTLHERNRTSKPLVSTRRITLTSAASPRLQRKLLRLLHEDQRVAERLIAQATIKHPGKTPDWYVDKVIYDLQRDRH
jgi:hypothetical protein